MRRRYFLAGLGALGACPLCTRRAAAADHEHWSYSGETGPEHWGEIDEANAACSAGSQQSPLNISDSVKAMLPPIGVSWKKTAAEWSTTATRCR
jgi:carbonic anhydrase